MEKICCNYGHIDCYIASKYFLHEDKVLAVCAYCWESYIEKQGWSVKEITKEQFEKLSLFK